MATRTIEQLKQWFRKGLYPTQAQFWDWLDSYRHKSDTVAMHEVAGLTAALNKKYAKARRGNLKKV